MLRVLGHFNRYLLVEDNEPIAMAIKANNDIQGIDPICLALQPWVTDFDEILICRVKCAKYYTKKVSGRYSLYFLH